MLSKCPLVGLPGGAGKLIAKVALIVVMGLFFGTALYRSRVFEPASIRLQFTFQRMIMFKVGLVRVTRVLRTVQRQFFFWGGRRMPRPCPDCQHTPIPLSPHRL